MHLYYGAYRETSRQQRSKELALLSARASPFILPKDFGAAVVACRERFDALAGCWPNRKGRQTAAESFAALPYSRI